MFCEAAKHVFQQIELQQWNPSVPWTWGDNIYFFVCSLLDLVWNCFVYARLWRLPRVTLQHCMQVRIRCPFLFWISRKYCTRRRKTNRRRAAKYKLHMARQPWRNAFISACKLWIHPKGHHILQAFYLDEWGRLLQRIYHKIEGNSSSKRNLSLWVSCSFWEGLVEHAPAQIRLQSSGCAPEPSLAECKPPSY